VPLGPLHASVVHAEAAHKQLFDVLAARLVDDAVHPVRVLALEQVAVLGVLLEDLDQVFGRLDGRVPLVHEDEHLLAHLQAPDDVQVRDVVHDVFGALDRAVVFDPVKPAPQRRRPVGRVEVERAFFGRVDEVRHIDVVRQRGRQPQDPDHALRPDQRGQRPGDQTLKHDTALVVQQVDLVDDHQVDLVHEAVAFSGDDVPLFGRGHDDVGLFELGLGQTDVAGHFSDLDVEVLEGLGELLDDFGGERFERSEVDDFHWLASHVYNLVIALF